MADMLHNYVTFAANTLTLTAGQCLRIQIINADGTLNTQLCSDSVPLGTTFTGNAYYNGKIA